MDDHGLELLLDDFESDRVERKSSPQDLEKVRQAVCALANDLPGHGKPGVVFIGVDDRGNPTQVDVNDELLRRVADIRSHGDLLPMPVLEVQRRRLRGCQLAVVVVHPSAAPPVRYRGRVYVRVGPTTRIATPAEEQRLSEKRRARDLPFDLQPQASAAIEDLDLDLFRRTYLPSALPQEVLAENARSIEEQLAALRFLTLDQPPQPTVLGILVAGKDPRRFIPGFYIQFLRIDGTALTDPIKDQREVGGPLAQLLSALDEVLKVHISVAADFASGDRDVRNPDYPLIALQQLARNAVLHRNYDGTHAPVRISWFRDRIEIQNPGGPYGQVNCENFGKPGITDYRNPHLAEAMKNLGYVQRFGVGIETARHALAHNRNPPVEFDVQPNYVLALVRTSS